MCEMAISCGINPSAEYASGLEDLEFEKSIVGKTHKRSFGYRRVS